VKKLVLCGITLVTLFGLTGCATSFNTSYDKAIVRMPNDEVVELKIDSVRYMMTTNFKSRQKMGRFILSQVVTAF